MKTILDVINAVDEKFSSPDKWTKGSYARDINGNNVGELNPKTTCWCLDGCVIAVSPSDFSINALEKNIFGSGVANDLGSNTLLYLLNKINKKFKVRARHVWNDAPDRTFADIKNLLAECKKELSA